MSLETAALLVSWIAILLLGLAIGGLISQVRAIESELIRRRVVDTGTPSRTIDLVGHNGTPIAPPFVALFVSEDCHVCNDVIPELSALAEQSHKDDVERLIVTNSKHTPANTELGQFRVVHDETAARRLDLPGFPWIVAVNEYGVVIHEGPGGPATKAASLFAAATDIVAAEATRAKA